MNGPAIGQRRPDADGRSRARPRRLGGIALVVGEREVALRVGHEQRRADRDLAERPLPDRPLLDGRRRRGPGTRGRSGRPGVSGPMAASRSAGVPAKVTLPKMRTWTIGDRRTPSPTIGRMTGSRASRRSGSSGPTVSYGTPAARCAATGAKMSRPWKLDVMTGSIRSRFSMARASTMPPSASAAGDEQPVVRADEDVAAGDLEGDRQPLRADARVDDRDVGADRHVRQARRPASRRRRGSSSAAPGG